MKFAVGILYKASFYVEFASTSGKYDDKDNQYFGNPHPFLENKEHRKKWIGILDGLI